ncbi:hypothetical protein MSTO_49570 [Mycobacterium stomatepiae]|uniref:Uncharacterized protein n=2 Tax=Mycobacterium stomatepiae TaxID=470076 RepID=A0A7I7QF16_9MYCO|nr:hypothetical protein [Mycobacterium stomatepiae]BBY24752.1 hypothetical protein MSTO_49570 [Mycobacterium stomatepiae]
MPSIPETPTTHLPLQASPGQGATRAAARSAPPPDRPPADPTPRTVLAAAAVSIISGWATSVVATDLITGWWRTDRLFCIAIAFLALVFATTTVAGVILLLQRRPLGRYLITAGAVVAVLTYGGVFIAGARVAWIVHAFPLLPIASAVLAMHPRTKRWLQE